MNEKNIGTMVLGNTMAFNENAFKKAIFEYIINNPKLTMIEELNYEEAMNRLDVKAIQHNPFTGIIEIKFTEVNRPNDPKELKEYMKEVNKKLGTDFLYSPGTFLSIKEEE